jgi:NAD(P)H dehydrogenase (quinone)
MLAQGVLPSFLPKDFAFDMIATADIGRVAAELLLEGTAAPGVVELGGPARSMADAAAALSAIVGRPIAVHEAPLEAMAATLTGFGMPKDLAAMYQEMMGAVLRGHVAFEGGHRRVQGTTPLATVLQGLVAAAR